MTTTPPNDPPLPAWLEELGATLPALVPLDVAAQAVSRTPRTLQRAADRKELMILSGHGGRGKALVPRAALLRWVASWPTRG